MKESEKIAACRRGERLTRADASCSIRDAEAEDSWKCRHNWRCIVCCSESDEDVDECSGCGKQEVHRCDFDEEFS